MLFIMFFLGVDVVFPLESWPCWTRTAHPVPVRTASVVEKKDAIGKLSEALSVVLRYGARGDGEIARQLDPPSSHKTILVYPRKSSTLTVWPIFMCTRRVYCRYKLQFLGGWTSMNSSYHDNEKNPWLKGPWNPWYCSWHSILQSLPVEIQSD